jgi:hypothetical protein
MKGARKLTEPDQAALHQELQRTLDAGAELA